MAVANARVYYHCHFIGDCIAGSVVGTSVAYAYNYANLSQTIALPIAQLILPI